MGGCACGLPESVVADISQLRRPTPPGPSDAPCHGAPSAYQVYGEGGRRAYFSRQDQAALKQEFGALIHAEADEVAFVQSTSDGENIVVAGLDLPRRGGNVVIDDLHFTTSLYMYKTLEARGLELRVVKQQDGRIPLEAMDRAIDGDTRLVSMALVSNINGFMHDAGAVSALAHARGAYLYADVIQAAGH